MKALNDAKANSYATYRWLADVQMLEPAMVEELDEIEQISKVIEESSIEVAELYTTCHL